MPTGRSSAASDVPFAVCWGSLASSTSPGTTRIAPPTPNKPATTPPTKPISATSTHVIVLSSLQEVRSPATAARGLDAEHVAGREVLADLWRQRRPVQQRAARPPAPPPPPPPRARPAPPKVPLSIVPCPCAGPGIPPFARARSTVSAMRCDVSTLPAATALG